MRKKKKLATTNNLELELLNRGFSRIVGIDEVGRGAWAGPVVVTGYVFEASSQTLQGLSDSKLINKSKREDYYLKLSMHNHHISLGEISMINKIGIGQTITSKIYEIIDKYDDGKTAFLIDGHFASDFGKNAMLIKKGDLKHYSIAAASNLGKVYRDELMYEYAKDFPEYGFDSNVGYGTKAHREVLSQIGPCELHRTSFKPIKLLLEQFKLI